MNNQALINVLKETSSNLLNHYVETVKKMHKSKDIEIKKAYYYVADDYLQSYNRIIIQLNKLEENELSTNK